MKAALRAIPGPLYPALVQLRRGRTMRALFALGGRSEYRRLIAANGDVFAVDLYERHGMGGLLSKAILFHQHAVAHGLTPSITSSNPLYAEVPGEDVLGTYFHRPGPSPGAQPISGVALDWAFAREIEDHIPLDRAARLFAELFRPRDLVADRVAQCLGSRDLWDASIHYRGTDKANESGPQTTAPLLREIDRLHDELGGRGDFFLATDEPLAEAELRARYPSSGFTTFNLSDLPAGMPRHFSAMSGPDKAVEALVNIFSIAAAPICVRSSSYMSAISAVVNPAMTTRTINATLDGSRLFPEREIVARER